MWGTVRILEVRLITVGRAGAVGIVKCVKLPYLGTEDDCKFLRSLTCFCRWVYLLTRFATDNEADLFVWDIAEATVTLMAACIPTLRLFLKEKTSSGPSGERTTRLSQFSLSFRSANRGRRMFNTQDIEVIPEHSIEKGKVLAGSGASRDGSVAGTSAGSGSGGVVVGEKTI